MTDIRNVIHGCFEKANNLKMFVRCFVQQLIIDDKQLNEFLHEYFQSTHSLLSVVMTSPEDKLFAMLVVMIFPGDKLAMFTVITNLPYISLVYFFEFLLL